MNYDKNSFLTGISVGRTLKGWAAGSEGFSGGGSGGGIYVGNFLPYPRFVGVVIEPDMAVSAFSAYPQFAGYNILPVIETGTFEVET